MNPLQQLRALGQAVWLDSIRRSYLAPGGYLPSLLAADEVDGLTSNPSIFEKALAEDDGYAEQLAELRGSDPRQALWAIMERDVVGACDLFADLYRSSGGTAGFVSIELDPSSAFDTEETVADGIELFHRLDRPNLMVKVPGTEAGLPAVTRLLAEGVNVNITLLFSVARYEGVLDAWVEGLRRRADAGGALGEVASVASFFVSRVDAKVDAQLGDDAPRVATAAIANARAAYGAFVERCASPEVVELLDAGARVQRPLWASTSTKSARYRDTIYVEELAGPDTVNTMPESTLDAVRDRGMIADRLTGAADEAREQLQRLAEQGVDLDQITKELESDGVERFVASFDAATETVAHHLAGDVTPP